MDLKSLHAVIAIADHGTFGDAARSLNLSVSSISLQVSALESHLGLKLFDRKTRPPAMTESGRAFVVRARKLIAEWDDLSGNFALDRTRGEIRIGAVHTSIVQVVPAALKQLQQRNPGLQIRLSTGLSHALEQQVIKRQLDCALTNLSEEGSSELETVLLQEEPMIVIAHREAIGGGWRELLEKNRYVRFARHAQVSRLIDAELTKQRIEVQSSMEIDTLDGVVALVRHGLGVSILPGNQKLQPLPESIRCTPFSEPVLHRRLGIIMRKDCEKPHLVSEIVSVLREVFSGKLPGD